MVHDCTHDIQLVRREIERVYGFQPSLTYCRDLIAFVDAMAPDQDAYAALADTPSLVRESDG